MQKINKVLIIFSLVIFSFNSFAKLPQTVNNQELPSLAPIVKQVSPAVVNISVSGTKASNQQIPDILRHFFGDRFRQRPNSEKRSFQGVGSGVIINAKKGFVITNNHVIDQADEIKIELIDGRILSATLIGSDKKSDVALLQVKDDDLTEIPFADSDNIYVGDFALAVGNPFGLGQTVTSGIISATGRSGLNIENLENFIQTDAAINSGNSGGALINLNGELVGMNTAILAPSGGNVGIGFAIPSNMIKNLVEQFIQYGEVRRGVLGVVGGKLTNEMAKEFGFDSKQGAFVSQVLPDSSAQKAGLKSGDVIVALNNKEINGFNELRAKIGTMGAGSKVKLTVLRDGEEKIINVTLGSSNDEVVQAKIIHPALDGATLKSTTEKDDYQGVKVVNIKAKSRAYLNGLEEGDIITGVYRNAINNIDDLKEILKKAPNRVALRIQRQKMTIYLIVQ